MAITSQGIGSGLDINSIVTQLMGVERRPITLLDQKEAGLQAKLTAYGSVQGALSNLQTAVSALATSAKFTANTATPADTTVVSASASSVADSGTYAINVTTLASAHAVASTTSFTNTTSTLGSGTLTINFGSYSGGLFTPNANKGATTITIDPTQNTLAAVRDKINAAGAGVSANIINDGSGFRLVITSKDTGTANALRITTVDDDGNNTNNAGLSQLNYDASTGGSSNTTQTVAATDASFSVNGLPITKSSNTVTDAIHGVTFNLLKTASATTVTVARDSAGIQSAVQTFVKAYNDAHKALADLSSYNATTKQAAQLQGDSTVRTAQSELRSILNGSLPTAGGGLSSLSDIGIAFQKDGTLTLSTVKLQAAIADQSKDLATLFASVGKPADSLISFASSTANTKPGSYAVNITQLSTQGKAVGSAPAATTITTGVNDTLTFTVDGNAATVTLAAGGYTAATLAAEVQSKMNGASTISAGGGSVSVTQSGGVLTVTSARYGATSNVVINGGNAVTNLFGTATSTTGVNVAGTLGGAQANGSGQTLTANAGDADGLSINVTGGITGNRGNVGFANGYAFQMNNLLTNMLGSTGLINARTSGINSTVATLGKQRDALNRRMTQIEARYRKQFTALDVAVANMNQTSAYLTQQLANLARL